MGDLNDRDVVVEASTAGLVTAVWYALPDVVASRRARGWIKAAMLLGSSLTMGTRAARAVEAETADGAVGTSNEDLAAVAALTSTDPVLPADVVGDGGSGSGPSLAAGLGAAAAGLTLVGLLVAGTVAGERAIHRFGERLAARGVRAPHTRIGVVAGALTAAGGWAAVRRLGD